MGESKTIVSDCSKVYWCPGDQIKVFQGGLSAGKFTSQNTENAATAHFKGVMDTFIGAIEDSSTDAFYTALYPYSENAEYSSEDNTIPVTVLSSFNAVEGTFPSGSFPCVAKSANMSLAFYNICGGIILTVAHDNITTIEFRGNNDEYIAGEMKVGFEELPNPPVAGGIESLGGTSRIPEVKGFISGSKSIKVMPPVGKPAFTPGVKYYVPMPPITFSKGFSLRFYVGDNYVTYTDTQSHTVKRSSFANLLEKDAKLNFDINNVFTVNDKGKKVKFSPGNLYWDGSKFCFEEHQYDYSTEWNPNHVTHFFWSKDASIAVASAYNDSKRAFDDKFFAIDGGAVVGWTVLSKSEWQYLIEHSLHTDVCETVKFYNDENDDCMFHYTGTYEQAKAAFDADTRIRRNYEGKSFDELYGDVITGWETMCRNIAGRSCVIMKPDGFNGEIKDSYTAEEWAAAEAAGLVALPFAGSRSVTIIYDTGRYGYYRSSTPDLERENIYDEYYAYHAYFRSYNAGTDYGVRNYGWPIRLVSVL